MTLGLAVFPGFQTCLDPAENNNSMWMSTTSEHVHVPFREQRTPTAGMLFSLLLMHLYITNAIGIYK